jgi:acetyl esterase/lipase
MPRAVDVLNATVGHGGFAVARDIPYGPARRQRMDIYRPARAAGPAPVVVWFYGGAWQSGRRGDYRFVAGNLARAGVVVAVPDYRLYPEARFPSFVEDGARAVAAARRLAPAHGGDPKRIFVAGHSAGAYIAAMLAIVPDYLASVGMARRDLAGMVGIAGPYDFLPILGADIRAVFAPAADDPRRTQPIAYADGGNPPLLLLHGACDGTCYPRNSLALAARVRAAGGPAEARLYRRVGHIGIVLGFSGVFRALSPALADTLGFIRGALDKPGARAIPPAA